MAVVVVALVVVVVVVAVVMVVLVAVLVDLVLVVPRKASRTAMRPTAARSLAFSASSLSIFDDMVLFKDCAMCNTHRYGMDEGGRMGAGVCTVRLYSMVEEVVALRH